ncbi:MAG: prepilin-type N-terminal cleavage/methylation domain-containing protein [Synergistaceae bacterium]|jgi:prepilin-type N-terminal cleavage/methylation domain-containing protein|nr:prepilin-type N-terminal cleavage/methylation domain-containing protein [Synergistaceae bacterium]
MRVKGRIWRRRGASLPEMIIALFVLAIVLLGLMAGMMISQGSMLYKAREGAMDVALRTLADFEATPLDSLWTKLPVSPIGMYTIQVTRTPSAYSASLVSADVSVEVSWGGIMGNMNKVVMNREVSKSASQNVGEIPTPQAP